MRLTARAPRSCSVHARMLGLRSFLRCRGRCRGLPDVRTAKPPHPVLRTTLSPGGRGFGPSPGRLRRPTSPGAGEVGLRLASEFHGIHEPVALCGDRSRCRRHSRQSRERRRSAPRLARSRREGQRHSHPLRALCTKPPNATPCRIRCMVLHPVASTPARRPVRGPPRCARARRTGPRGRRRAIPSFPAWAGAAASRQSAGPGRGRRCAATSRPGR